MSGAERVVKRLTYAGEMALGQWELVISNLEADKPAVRGETTGFRQTCDHG
jgi:hypothetical protein